MTSTTDHHKPSFVLGPGLVFLALPVLASGAGCGDTEGFAAEDPADSESAPDTRVPVRAMAIDPGSLTDMLEISGRLEPRAEILVASELGGAVEEVLFDKGDRVREGQLLARIGSDLLQAELAEVEADLEEARIEFERTRQLVDREAAPEQDLTSGRASLKREEARAESARLRLARSEITAPASGVVIRRDLEPGEVLAPGSPVALLHDTSVLRATLGIPENDIAVFQVGSPAEITMDAYPDRTFSGRLSYLAPAASRPGRNFPAEIEIANPDGALRSGLIVRARLERNRYEEAVVLVRDSLIERDGVHYAFVLEDGKAVQRRLELGPEQSGQVLVAGGLGVGEMLIVEGHRNLLDGQPVRPVDGR